MKKLLALLLSLCMVFASVGVVSAADYTDISVDNTYSEAIKVLSDLNILNGFEDNSFKPNDTVTRAQMAKILCAALGYQNIGAAAGKFADVSKDHWAAGYIETISSLGIVNGYGNDMFGPEDPVTYEQAITMVVRTLGYEPAVGNANYPTGYLTKAGDLGLTKNISGNFSTPMMRKHVAQLVFNALDVPLMTQSGYGTFTQYIINDGYSSSLGTVNVKKTILSENHNIVKVQGTIESSSDSVSTNKNAKDYVIVDVTNAYNNKYGANINGKMYVGDTNIMDYVGKKVVLFVKYDEFNNDKTIKSFYEVADVDSVVIDLADVISMTDSEIKYYVNDYKTATVELSANTKVYYNGYLNCPIDYADLITMSGSIELSLLDDDTTDANYDTMYINAYDIFVVDEVRATAGIVTSKVDTMTMTSDRIYFDADDVKATLYDANGYVMKWSQLDEYDVLAVKYVNSGVKDIYEAWVVENVITGEIDEISSDAENKYVSINGNEYKVLAVAETDEAIKLGDEGVYYLDFNNNIVYHSTIVSKNSNYAYVIDTKDANGMDNAQIKMLTKDNDIVTVDVASKLTVIYEGDKVNMSAKDIYFDNYVGEIITFKTNANGQINTIENASAITDVDYLSVNFTDATLENYDADAESFKINGRKYYINKNTVIFNVDGDVDDYEIVALKNLAEGQDLIGADIYDIDDDRVIGAIVLKETNTIDPVIDYATFVTKVTTTYDEDGYEVIRVSGLVGLDEVSYICENNVDVKEGTLVIPSYKANGDVKAFIPVENVDNTTLELKGYAGALEVLDLNDDEDLDSPIVANKKLIYLNGNENEEFKVPTTANIYVYDATSSLRTKYKAGVSLGYFDYDEDLGIYIDKDDTFNDVEVYLYEVEGDIVDVLYYIY